MCHDIVEGSVVSVRQLYHYRIRREGVMKLSNLSPLERPLDDGGTSFPMNWRQQRATSYSIRRE